MIGEGRSSLGGTGRRRGRVEGGRRRKGGRRLSGPAGGFEIARQVFTLTGHDAEAVSPQTTEEFAAAGKSGGARRGAGPAS